MAHRVILRLLGAFLLVLPAACAAPPPASQPPPPTAPHTRVPLTPTVLPSPTATTFTPPTAAPSPTSSPFRVCSPLLGISTQDLSSIVANPYHPPPLGSDDPHQGVDLAQVKDGIALTGLPVQAVLPGRVALVISGRFPYGNALLVETALDSLPSSFLESLALPSLPAAPEVHSALTCPADVDPSSYDFEKRSLYLLYAHLLAPPVLALGDALDCGQVIGAIGDSGNALNPHLHLELRLGPSGASFPGMAHYDTSATPQEMAGYCQWRLSGAFLPLDPDLLFQGN